MKLKIILFSSLILLCIVGIALTRLITNKPPDAEINLARKMLLETELMKSPKYANEHYRMAQNFYDSAMLEWERQNDRPQLFRNYKGVIEFAEKSGRSSQSATDIAKQNLSEIQNSLKFRIDELGRRIRTFDEILGKLPMNSSHRTLYSKSKILYSEAVLAYKNNNYTTCNTKLDSVENVINQVFIIYEEKYNSYLNDHTKWMDMVDQTINDSKKNKSYALLIDKLARECRIYKDGKVAKTFTIEMGQNWIGDKNHQGDKSTPEGYYKVIDKKSNGQTRFYKALLLNYPNDEDKKRFIENKKNGIVDVNASIGKLIEIHGNGGKGVDWTDGCIALRDIDMDLVFKLCPVGTKVSIVGSAKSLSELSLKENGNK